MNEHIGIPSSNLGSIIRSSSKALTVTSKNFEELRTQITDIYNKREALLKQLQSANIKLFALTCLHVGSFLVLVGFFYKRISLMRSSQQEVVALLKKQLSETFVSLTFADKSQLEKSWLNCIDAFAALMSSKMIWDLTYSEDVNSVQARTIAKTSFKRTAVTPTKRDIEFIKSDLSHLVIPNANGPDLFLFPTFMILFKDKQKFGIFDLLDIQATLELTSFIEEEKLPSDTEKVGFTWKKANKDGSMDKRFKGNYQIPIVKYGQMTLTSETGLEEGYMFSNFDAFSDFAKTYIHHMALLQKLS